MIFKPANNTVINHSTTLALILKYLHFLIEEEFSMQVHALRAVQAGVRQPSGGNKGCCPLPLLHHLVSSQDCLGDQRGDKAHAAGRDQRAPRHNWKYKRLIR